MTIDEAIAWQIKLHGMENDAYKTFRLENCKKFAEEHKQYAEWLEELKAYREIETVEECKNSILDIEKAYNKAIDDFAEKIKENISESFIWGMLVDSHKDNSFNDASDKIVDYIIDTVKETAEQLKAGESE